jgi:hypothetical protein
MREVISLLSNYSLIPIGPIREGSEPCLVPSLWIAKEGGPILSSRKGHGGRVRELRYDSMSRLDVSRLSW